ncbi:hypothetical protein BH23CYA1_BH23CYA1_15450 [soil metagenome]
MKRFFSPSLRQRLAPHSRQRSRVYCGLLVAGSLLVAGLGEVAPQPFRKAATATPDAQIARAGEPWQIASFPVEGFQAYTSAFGYRGSSFHYCLDIASPSGSYIRNWWEGRVVEVSDDSACGTSVIIESGDWTHVYCHMQGYVTYEGGTRVFVDSGGGLRLAEGQGVATGDRIGRVGMTGRTTGPHLHWGMRYQGNWVDPALVLQAMSDGQRRAALPQ